MRQRRARGTGRPARDFSSAELCHGPGNLTRALGITLRQNLSDLTGSALRIEDRRLPLRNVAWTPRIGITVGVESEWCVAVGSARCRDKRKGQGTREKEGKRAIAV
jgi:3-methyladenine DNA glycosylase Mpg